MAINKSDEIKSPSGKLSFTQDGLNPWVKLAIGIAMILLFIFGFGYLSKYIPGAKRMSSVIDDHDLKATAIFYTDFEASAEGSEYIRHSLQYPPQK